MTGSAACPGGLPEMSIAHAVSGGLPLWPWVHITVTRLMLIVRHDRDVGLHASAAADDRPIEIDLSNMRIRCGAGFLVRIPRIFAQ